MRFWFLALIVSLAIVTITSCNADSERSTEADSDLPTSVLIFTETSIPTYTSAPSKTPTPWPTMTKPPTLTAQPTVRKETATATQTPIPTATLDYREFLDKWSIYQSSLGFSFEYPEVYSLLNPSNCLPKENLEKPYVTLADGSVYIYLYPNDEIDLDAFVLAYKETERQKDPDWYVVLEQDIVVGGERAISLTYDADGVDYMNWDRSETFLLHDGMVIHIHQRLHTFGQPNCWFMLTVYPHVLKSFEFTP